MGGLPAPSGMSYDAAGNLTSLNGATLTYNSTGRLITAGGATYTYDSAGRRVSKTVNGLTTYYLYDGSVVIAEVDGNGNVQTAYTWGVQGLVSDRVQTQAGTQSRFYKFDVVGNTCEMLDSNGAGLGTTPNTITTINRDGRGHVTTMSVAAGGGASVYNAGIGKLACTPPPLKERTCGTRLWMF